TRSPALRRGSAWPSLAAQRDAALDGRPTHADRDQLLLAAPAAFHPGERVADVGDGLQHVESHARDRRVADRATELAVPDLVAFYDPEHEFAGPVGLTVARPHQIVAAIDRPDHVLEPVAARQDRGVAHAHQRLVAEGEGARIAGRLGPELPRRVLVVQEGLQHAVLDDGDVAARRAFVVDMDRPVRLAVGSAAAIVAERDFLRRDLP